MNNPSQHRTTKTRHSGLRRNPLLRPPLFALLAMTTALQGHGLVMAQSTGKSQNEQLLNALEVLQNAENQHKNRAGKEEGQIPTETRHLDQKMQEAIHRIDQPERSPETVALEKKASAALEEAKTNLSPEGTRRLSQPIPAPSFVAVAAPPSPDPKPRKAPKIAPKKKDETIITTGPEGTGIFDGNRKIAIFADATDGVILDNPRIQINCEELEIHFKDGPTSSGTETATEGADSDKKPDTMLESSSIDVAYARGKRVILQKKHADGKIQIGQCREAVYDGKTGDLVLKIWPQIQEDDHTVVARAASTRILILRDGRLRFVGPTETKVSNKP